MKTYRWLKPRLLFRPQKFYNRHAVHRELSAQNRPVEVPAGVSRAAMLEAMAQDKKRAGGRCRVVVLERVGRAAVREVELSQLQW